MKKLSYLFNSHFFICSVQVVHINQEKMQLKL